MHSFVQGDSEIGNRTPYLKGFMLKEEKGSC